MCVSVCVCGRNKEKMGFGKDLRNSHEGLLKLQDWELKVGWGRGGGWLKVGWWLSEGGVVVV